MRQKINTQIFNFLIGSVTLHLALLLVTYFTPLQKTHYSVSNLEVEIVDKTSQEKYDKNETQQVVQQDNISYNEEVPEHSNYLSQKNQKVLKESVSINKGKYQNIHQALPKISLQKIIPQMLKIYDSSDDLFQIKNKDEPLNTQKEYALEVENLTGTDQPQESSVSQSDDHLKDVDQGLETLLNTKEYKFYSYFSRVREQLSQHWQPKVREKMVKYFQNNQRAPASLNQERVTKLLITLNEQGILVKVQVLQDSGIQDLDDAAIEAFRAAAPFPNPPKGVVETNGTVQIRWDFVLET